MIGRVLKVDTALSTEGRFPPTVGDFLVHFGDHRTVIVSARYTEAVDVGQAVELARDAWGELVGPVPRVMSVERCHAINVTPGVELRYVTRVR